MLLLYCNHRTINVRKSLTTIKNSPGVPCQIYTYGIDSYPRSYLSQRFLSKLYSLASKYRQSVTVKLSTKDHKIM